ncbi:MAG: hypothetical protein NVSMB9_00570 [Isosphaeraceae bacterium]
MFSDNALARRGREIERDAILREAQAPPSSDPAGHWIKLARETRRRKLDEPLPSSLAHKGFRAALDRAITAEELTVLIQQIEGFFPGSIQIPARVPDLSLREKDYLTTPDEVYRSVTPQARALLDRRLWADARQKLLERQAEDDPKTMLALAEEAAKSLPDRPSLSERLLKRGIALASSDVGSLRQSEVDSLAALYRSALHQPEKALGLYRSWLDDQRNRRISPRDAEGRVALAGLYESLLDDRATALALLREAWKVDPESTEVADAFRRHGFRRVNSEWIEPNKAVQSAVPSSATDGAKITGRTGEQVPNVGLSRGPGSMAAESGSLRGATPDDVRARFGGQPNRKCLVATQGRLVEQWIYQEARKTYYINILRKPGEIQSRVVSFYARDQNPSSSLLVPNRARP